MSCLAAKQWLKTLPQNVQKRHSSAAKSWASHWHLLLPVLVHPSRPVSSHLPWIFKPFHSFHFPAIPPNTTRWECTSVCVCVWAHACVTAMKTGGGEARDGRGLLTCQSVLLFLRLRCAHQEGVFLLESSVMNRRLARCLIKFHLHIYLAFQKCSAYQWVLLTCQSRKRSASSALWGVQLTGSYSRNVCWWLFICDNFLWF